MKDKFNYFSAVLGILVNFKMKELHSCQITFLFFRLDGHHFEQHGNKIIIQQLHPTNLSNTFQFPNKFPDAKNDMSDISHLFSVFYDDTHTHTRVRVVSTEITSDHLCKDPRLLRLFAVSTPTEPPILKA